MPPFKMHNIKTAPDKSKILLEKIKNNMGFISHFFCILAESPEALESYLTLDKLFSESSFSKIERAIILLIISQENLSDYCREFHTQKAKKCCIPDDIIFSIREGKHIQDMRLHALRSFIQKIMSKKNITVDVVEKFLSMGYTHKNILDILIAVAMKTLSNYINTIARTPIDDAYKVKVNNLVLSQLNNL